MGDAGAVYRAGGEAVLLLWAYAGAGRSPCSGTEGSLGRWATAA